MHAAIFVADVAETQGVHLAAELQSCRTDELIDKRELNSRTRIFENCRARNGHWAKVIPIERILHNEQAY
jgi:hypothetical protein